MFDSIEGTYTIGNYYIFHWKESPPPTHTIPIPTNAVPISMYRHNSRTQGPSPTLVLLSEFQHSKKNSNSGLFKNLNSFLLNIIKIRFINMEIALFWITRHWWNQISMDWDAEVLDFHDLWDCWKSHQPNFLTGSPVVCRTARNSSRKSKVVFCKKWKVSNLKHRKHWERRAAKKPWNPYYNFLKCCIWDQYLPNTWIGNLVISIKWTLNTLMCYVQFKKLKMTLLLHFQLQESLPATHPPTHSPPTLP